MANKPFVKKPGEKFKISIDFVNSLPTGASLSTATISAIDDESNNISNIVLNTTTGVISGTKVFVFLKDGTEGMRAHIKVKVFLDDNYTELEENLLMKINEES